MNRYKKLKFVGEGSFARVYKVIDKKTQQIMALKCIKKDGKSELEIDKLMEEIMILQSLSHKNIIRIIEWFVTETEICVVTEYADKGELFKIIKKKENKLSEVDIKIIAKQLVSALQFLHCSRIIHRDIKPQNILLSKHNVIKLCDFGFARALSEESTMATSIKGTPLYMAPELVQEKPYNDKVDLWSLGVILYELYYGKPPFYTNSIYKLVKMIVKDHIKYPINPAISKEFQHFINGLLQKNPLKRFNIERLHTHPFLHVHITNQISEEKDVEIVQNTTTTSPASSYRSSTKSTKSTKCTLSPSSTSDSTASNVKQKVFEILDSNDMNMINKILIVLPQRWQSLCSLSTGQNMQFEVKLFQKLYILLTKTENNSFVKNIVNVMYLTINRMQKFQKYEINYVVMQNTLNHITKTKYFHSCLLFPTICKLMKSIINLKDEKILKFMINEEFISSFIFNSDLSNITNVSNVIDIISQIIEYYPLECYLTTTKLKLNAFSKLSISQIPIYKFWRNIQTQICKSNQLNLFLKNILKQHSKYTLKFLLFLLKTSHIIRNNIEKDLSVKRLLILYVCDKILDTETETETQLNGLSLLYHLKNVLNIQTNEIQNIENVLNKLSNSSNIIVSNLSRSILIINHKYLNSDYKILWQNNLSFIQTQTDLNNVLFADINKNIFDFWCNTLSVIDIKQNVKLSITISLQLFNILTKRIEYIINKENNKENNNKEYIISAQSLDIFLKFYYQILKILISDTCLSINQYQKNQLMKEFLCKNHIKTLSILGNPQFILEYVSILPFYVDTLYEDLIECCNMSYSSILLIYRFLASQYSKNISSQTKKAFISPAFNRGHHTFNALEDNKIIYNFHKITLEFQLISSILNYIQISSPKQKEESCNLLFYITWKQSLFMKEFLNNNGLLIITNSIIKQRKYHSNNIIIQVLQIISCTARKYKQFYDKIEKTGIFTLIPKYLLSDTESIEIKEKICNLIGNLCKHSDKFLNIIKRENLLKLLCECTENKLSTNIRRFACYAIGNIAYQSTKNTNNNNNNTNNNYRDLIICIKPLSLRLQDEDYKTQENAAGAIGNLVSQQSNNFNNDIEIIINEILKNNVVKLLLNEIRINIHLCVIRNCLYSLSNICYFSKFKKSMIRYGWRHILKNCLDSYGNKDQFVKKYVFKILRKMESTKNE